MSEEIQLSNGGAANAETTLLFLFSGVTVYLLGLKHFYTCFEAKW